MSRLAIKCSPVPRFIALALAAGLWSASGCGGSNHEGSDAGGMPDTGMPDTDMPAGPTGNVQFIHATPNVAGLALYVHGQTTPIMPFALYGDAKAQLKAPAGTVQFDVRLEGAPVSTSPIYTSPAVALAENGSLTVIAVGLLPADPNTPVPADQAFRLLALSRDTTRPAAGKARLRVVNAMYSAPAAAVDIGDDGQDEIASLPRLTASEAPIEVAAGNELAIGITGLSSATPVVRTRVGAITVAGASLGDGADDYLVFTGLSAVPPRRPDSTSVIMVPSDGKAAAVTVKPNPVVYVLAASPDASGLDVYLGATKLAGGLAFGQLASRRELRPTATGYTLDVRTAGANPADAPVASLSTGELAAGQQYLAVLTGLVTHPSGAADALALRVYRDEMSLGGDFGHLVVVHAGLGAGVIDAGRYVQAQWNPLSDFQAIAPGGTSPSGGTVIEPNNINQIPVILGARRAASPALALSFESFPALGALDRAFAVLAGVWEPSGNQLPARFILVKTAVSGPWTTSVLSPIPTSIEVTPGSSDLAIGDRRQFVATEVFGNGTSLPVTGVVTWTLADPAIAGLTDVRGQVTGKALGATTITAKHGEVTGKATIQVVPRPAITSIVPADAVNGVDPGTPIRVAFSQPIAPATLVAQTVSGACDPDGTLHQLQLSADNFVTCLGFAQPAPVMDASGKIATFQPAAALSANITYRIRVSGKVTSPGGVEMQTDVTQATGFRVAVGLAVAATQPADRAVDVLPATSVVVAFNRAIAPATLIAQTTAGTCTGTLQVSADGFATCVGFVQASPVMDPANQVATFQPAAALDAAQTYRIRVLGAVTSTAGVEIGNDFTQTTGFATVSLAAPVVTATSPSAGATGIATATAISVSFSVAIAPASLTAQTASGACTGTLQLSSDSFATCVGFTQAAPVLEVSGRVATFQPRSPLAGPQNYEIRVTGAVTSIAGVAMGSDVTQAPGFRTTCAGRLVISQVFGGGGQAALRHDFIELHNVGSEPVDLGGFGLLATIGTSSAWSAQALTSMQIPPGGFFLIQESPGSTVNMSLPALPTPDYTPPALLNINAVNAKLALTAASPSSFSGVCVLNSTTPVFDLLGYGNTGAGGCSEGGSPLAALTTSTAAIRNDSGCRDTNVNSNDFTAVAPSPRNSASPAQLCSCR